MSGPVWDFLESLRPYRGPRLDCFWKLMEWLVDYAQSFRGEQIDRRLVADAWSVAYFTRAWALEPGGMIRRNKLITNADLDLLRKWLDAFESTVFRLLEGASIARSLGHFGSYL